jgi:hypothetical protein
MKESQKTTTEIMDIVIEVSTAIGKVGLVCMMLALLVSLGY